MAKKKTAGEFNMAEEIRRLLRASRKMAGKDVYRALVAKFPNQTINEGSCGVAFSNARKLLGISTGLKKKVVKKKVAKRRIAKKQTAAQATVAVDIPTLQAAAKCVSEIGGADKAIAAIKQLKTLQFD